MLKGGGTMNELGCLQAQIQSAGAGRAWDGGVVTSGRKMWEYPREEGVGKPLLTRTGWLPERSPEITNREGQR